MYGCSGGAQAAVPGGHALASSSPRAGGRCRAAALGAGVSAGAFAGGGAAGGGGLCAAITNSQHCAALAHRRAPVPPRGEAAACPAACTRLRMREERLASLLACAYIDMKHNYLHAVAL
jgi:hypothetical protein